MIRVIKNSVHSPMSRKKCKAYWSFAGWLCDCDMRIWEVIPRHSYMNLTRAFVSSTIDRPHLPESHLKVTKSHFSCQSLFIEPWFQDWGQRVAPNFFLGIWWYVLRFSCSDWYLWIPLMTLKYLGNSVRRGVFTCILYTATKIKD